jgi:site-specific DNA-methyltransferase (adenine-specific)
MSYELICGDCLDVMRGMEDNSIDAIVTDPPYFRVKDEPWDNQWDTRRGFLSWLGMIADEWRRILRPNGSAYVFASPQMAWHVEGVIRERFNLLNRINWLKDSGWHQKSNEESLRCYFPQTETVLFAEQFNSDNIALGESGYNQKCDELRGFVFEPIRKYLDDERVRAGVTVRQVAEEFQRKTGSRTVTGMAGHWFTSVQWTLPTKDNYEWLRMTLSQLNHSGDYLRTQYDYLRTQYEDLRTQYEDLRRPFNATPDAPYTDVWTFPTVPTYPGKHPCEKPLAMMEHIVNLSTRRGDLVLDCFMGSGATGVATVRAGRRFVGVDQSQHWVDYADRRIYDASRARQGQPKHIRGTAADFVGMPLFEVAA